MTTLPIGPVNKGLVLDSPPLAVTDPSVWTDGNNVRFHDGSVEKSKGFEKFLAELDVAPTFVFYWPHPLLPLYIYSDGPFLYAIDERGRKTQLRINTATNTDGSINYNAPVFSSDAYGTADSIWQGLLFNGGFSAIFNDGSGNPVAIRIDDRTLPTTSDTDLNDIRTGFSTLRGWEYTYSTTDGTQIPGVTSGTVMTDAAVMGEFGNTLIAGNLTLTVGSTSYEAPGTIRISSRAAPGALPATWEPGALGEASSADELELSITSPITSIRELQGAAIVYTEDSIHRIQIGAATTIPTTLVEGYGALGPNTVLEYDGRHFVVGSDDIYIFEGHPGSIQSVSDNVFRRYFYDNLNQTSISNTFLLRDIQYDEIWVCFPNLDSEDGSCNEAIRWNYRDNTWSKGRIPNSLSGTTGVITGGGTAGATLTFTGLNAPAGGQVVLTVPESFTTTGIDSQYTDNAEGTGDGRLETVNILSDGGNDPSRSVTAATVSVVADMVSLNNPTAAPTSTITSSNVTGNRNDRINFLSSQHRSGRGSVDNQGTRTFDQRTPTTNRRSAFGMPNNGDQLFWAEATDETGETAFGAIRLEFTRASGVSDEEWAAQLQQRFRITLATRESSGTLQLSDPDNSNTRLFSESGTEITSRTFTNSAGTRDTPNLRTLEFIPGQDTIQIRWFDSSRRSGGHNIGMIVWAPAGGMTTIPRRTYTATRDSLWTNGNFDLEATGVNPINFNDSNPAIFTRYVDEAEVWNIDDLTRSVELTSSRWNFSGPDGLDLQDQKFSSGGSADITTTIRSEAAMNNMASVLAATSQVQNAEYNPLTRELEVTFIPSSSVSPVTTTAASQTLPAGENGNASWSTNPDLRIVSGVAVTGTDTGIAVPGRAEVQTITIDSAATYTTGAFGSVEEQQIPYSGDRSNIVHPTGNEHVQISASTAFDSGVTRTQQTEVTLSNNFDSGTNTNTSLTIGNPNVSLTVTGSTNIAGRWGFAYTGTSGGVATVWFDITSAPTTAGEFFTAINGLTSVAAPSGEFSQNTVIGSVASYNATTNVLTLSNIQSTGTSGTIFGAITTQTQVGSVQQTEIFNVVTISSFTGGTIVAEYTFDPDSGNVVYNDLLFTSNFAENINNTTALTDIGNGVAALDPAITWDGVVNDRAATNLNATLDLTGLTYPFVVSSSDPYGSRVVVFYDTITDENIPNILGSIANGTYATAITLAAAWVASFNTAYTAELPNFPAGTSYTVTDNLDGTINITGQNIYGTTSIMPRGLIDLRSLTTFRSVVEAGTTGFGNRAERYITIDLGTTTTVQPLIRVTLDNSATSTNVFASTSRTASVPTRWSFDPDVSDTVYDAGVAAGSVASIQFSQTAVDADFVAGSDIGTGLLSVIFSTVGELQVPTNAAIAAFGTTVLTYGQYFTAISGTSVGSTRIDWNASTRTLTFTNYVGPVVDSSGAIRIDASRSIIHYCFQ